MRMAAMAATLPLGALRRRTATRPVSRLSEPRAVQEPHARHRHLPMFHALNFPAVVKAQNRIWLYMVVGIRGVLSDKVI